MNKDKYNWEIVLDTKYISNNIRTIMCAMFRVHTLRNAALSIDAAYEKTQGEAEKRLKPYYEKVDAAITECMLAETDFLENLREIMEELEEEVDGVFSPDEEE